MLRTLALAGAAVGAVFAGGSAGADVFQDNHVRSTVGEQNCGVPADPEEGTPTEEDAGSVLALPVPGPGLFSEGGTLELDHGVDGCHNGPVVNNIRD